MKTSISHFVPFLLAAATAAGCVSSGEQMGDDSVGGTEPDAGTGGGSGSGSGSGSQTAICGDNVCASTETTTSCPADCPATALCGDGICSGTETSGTCSQDCPSCGNGTCEANETSAGCPSDCASGACTVAPDNCTGDTVCISGTCAPAFGRVYKLVIAGGAVPEKTTTNEAWDPFGGLPDPYVNAFLNSTFAFATSYKTDTLSPAWNESTVVTIGAGSKLQLDVKDDDFDVDGSMFSCFSVALGADVLRKHGGAYMATCSGSPTGTNVRFYFVPQ
jgi:hypothetical protein